jgi:hypothetical protein
MIKFRHLTTLTTLTTSVAAVAAALSITLLATPVRASESGKAPANPGPPAYEPLLAAQLGTLQRLKDESDLRSLMVAYGRGNDAMSIHYADRVKARQLGASEYAKAFTANTRVEVHALGVDKPIGQVTGVAAWVDFVDKFYAGYGYSSTLHPMSNFEFGFDGPDRARISAYALAPHFFLKPAARDEASADTAIEWMLCRYAAQAERQADGSWKLAALQINLEEMSRTPGFYAGGQRNGR